MPQLPPSQPLPQTTKLLAGLLLLALALLALSLNAGQAEAASGFEDEEYTTYAEMETYLEELELNNPELVEVSVIGTTEEGRSIYAVKVSDPGNQTYFDLKEPELLFIGGHHGNELMGIEMSLYLLDHLVQNYTEDHDVREMLDNTELWFVPMLNPDGHVYVEEEDHRWRKNRRDNGDGSFGVDLNRNYAYEWGTDAHTSDDPDDDNYHGPEPFSEPETRAIRDLAQNHSFSFSLSFHSSGQEILFPWGYEKDPKTPDHDLQKRLADKMAAFNGYDVGKASDLYPAKGDSEDYLYSIGVLPFTIELARSNSPSDPLPELKLSLPSWLYLIHSSYQMSRLQLEYNEDGELLGPGPDYAPEGPWLSKEAIWGYLNNSHQWNWIIYMSGDSSLSSEVEDDLSQIQGAQIPSYMKVIVLADQRYDHNTKLYVIDSSGTQEHSLSEMNPDYGDELRLDHVDVLVDFLNWSLQNHPAEHNFLELWGHGKGWLYSVYEGSQDKSMDAREFGMAVQEALALQGGEGKANGFSRPFDVMGFDECAMGNIETMVEVHPYTDYYMGSEKDEPFDGWPYHEVLEAFSQHQLLLPWELSRTVAETMVNFYNENPDEAKNIPVLFSVMDTKAIPDFLEGSEALFQKLRNRLSNDSFLRLLQDQRRNTEEYERNDFLDFYHFLELVEAASEDFEVDYYIQNILADWEDLVLLSLGTNEEVGDSPVTENARGLSIYFPEDDKTLKYPYPQLAFNSKSGWHDFLYEYVNGREPEYECYLKNSSFSFQDQVSDEDVATRLFVNFTLYSEIQREDITVLINGTSQLPGGGESKVNFYTQNLSLEPGTQYYTLSFYQNFTGSLKLELLVLSELYQDGIPVWEGAQELDSALTFFSREADLHFQKVELHSPVEEVVGPGEIFSFPSQTRVLDPGIYLPAPALRKDVPYILRVWINSQQFSTYASFSLEYDGDIIYQNSFFLRENSSRLVELELAFPNNSHSLRLVLDSGNAVNETNETNNVLEFAVSAYKAQEVAILEEPVVAVELDSYLNATTGKVEGGTLVLASPLINNSSPLDITLNYFYAVSLSQQSSGKAYTDSYDEKLLDAAIAQLEAAGLPVQGQILLPAGGSAGLELSFTDYDGIADFCLAHKDVVLVVDVVFYPFENQTADILQRFEEDNYHTLELPIYSISFYTTLDIQPDPGQNNSETREQEDNSTLMDSVLMGVLLLAALGVFFFLFTRMQAEAGQEKKPVELSPTAPREEPAPVIKALEKPPESVGGDGDDTVIEIED